MVLPKTSRARRWTFRVLKLALLGATFLAGWWYWPELSAQWARMQGAVLPKPPDPPVPGPRVAVLATQPLRVSVPQELLDGKRYAVAEVGPPPPPEPLRLNGSIILDPNRNARVHSLFAGQAVKVGRPGDMAKTSAELVNNPKEGLRPNDRVRKGQILCVVWSKDVGALKTDLINQLSKERADRIVLDRYLSVPVGAIALNPVTQARQQVETDMVAVRNARRNLRAVGFTEAEIEVVEAEGRKLEQSGKSTEVDLETERTWAEFPVRAPFDGVIVEKNVTLGDPVDPSQPLFKLTQLDALQVRADVIEEDLLKLRERLTAGERVPADVARPTSVSDGLTTPPPHPCEWTLTYQTGGPAAVGRFEKISPLVDPVQHTGSVTGWVANPDGKLFVGQFVTAVVKLPPDPALVAVPADAVVEQTEGTAVFVATERGGREFVRRPVAVVVRGRDVVFLRKTPTPEEERRGLQGVRVGEQVIAHGAVELAAEAANTSSTGK